MIQVNIENKIIIIKDNERQLCEIWTRVMGYYRPIVNFNIGKKGEHAERVNFKEESSKKIDE